MHLCECVTHVAYQSPAQWVMSACVLPPRFFHGWIALCCPCLLVATALPRWRRLCGQEDVQYNGLPSCVDLLRHTVNCALDGAYRFSARLLGDIFCRWRMRSVRRLRARWSGDGTLLAVRIPRAFLFLPRAAIWFRFCCTWALWWALLSFWVLCIFRGLSVHGSGVFGAALRVEGFMSVGMAIPYRRLRARWFSRP